MYSKQASKQAHPVCAFYNMAPGDGCIVLLLDRKSFEEFFPNNHTLAVYLNDRY